MTTTEQELIDGVRRDLRQARVCVQNWEAYNTTQHIRDAESKLTQLEAMYQAKQRAEKREGVGA
jgi:hypothetical protein